MISVVIPLRDEEEFIIPCLEAFTRQSWPGEFELIVVDNGSRDGSVACIESFRRAHPRLSLRLLQEAQPGAAAASQTGFRAARYPLIARTDADTLVDRDWLAAIAAGFADPQVIALCGRVGFHQPTRLQRLLHVERLIEFHQRLHIGLRRPHFWGFNFAVRREKFWSIDGFNTRLRLGEDLDLALRLQGACRRGERIRYAPGMRVYSSSRRYHWGPDWRQYTIEGYRAYFNLAWLGRQPGWMYAQDERSVSHLRRTSALEEDLDHRAGRRHAGSD